MKIQSCVVVLSISVLAFSPMVTLSAPPQEVVISADPTSVAAKLHLVERIAHDFIIVLKGSGDPPYQVSITTANKLKRGYFVGPSIPEFGPGKEKRSRFVKFAAKTVPDPVLTVKDVSEMTVEDRLRKTTLVLVKDVPQNLAEYEAKFEFKHGDVTDTFTVQKGSDFHLKGFPNTTYRLMDVLEDTAVVSPMGADGKPGTEIVIKKG